MPRSQDAPDSPPHPLMTTDPIPIVNRSFSVPGGHHDTTTYQQHQYHPPPQHQYFGPSLAFSAQENHIQNPQVGVYNPGFNFQDYLHLHTSTSSSMSHHRGSNDSGMDGHTINKENIQMGSGSIGVGTPQYSSISGSSNYTPNPFFAGLGIEDDQTYFPTDSSNPNYHPLPFSIPGSVHSRPSAHPLPALPSLQEAPYFHPYKSPRSPKNRLSRSPESLSRPMSPINFSPSTSDGGHLHSPSRGISPRTILPGLPNPSADNNANTPPQGYNITSQATNSNGPLTPGYIGSPENNPITTAMANLVTQSPTSTSPGSVSGRIGVGQGVGPAMGMVSGHPFPLNSHAPTPHPVNVLAPPITSPKTRGSKAARNSLPAVAKTGRATRPRANTNAAAAIPAPVPAGIAGAVGESTGKMKVKLKVKGKKKDKDKEDEDMDDENDNENESDGEGDAAAGIGPGDSKDSKMEDTDPDPDPGRNDRIAKEQRRRLELREAFGRLRECLPPTNLRPSKASLLDRAKDHIIHIDSANRYLTEQLEDYKKQLEGQRATNDELVRALARNGIPSSTTTPSEKN